MKNFTDEMNKLMAMASAENTEIEETKIELDPGFFDRTKMPKKYYGVDFTVHPNKVTERVQKFCTRKNGGILLLIGPVGTGKTETACCCFLERANHGLNAGEYLNAKYTLGPAYRSTRLSNSPITELQFFEHYQKLPFLVLDEVGRGDDVDVEKRVVSNLINACYDNDTKIVITTNMNTEQLAQFLGDRDKDRLREISEVCVLDGESWRGR